MPRLLPQGLAALAAACLLVAPLASAQMIDVINGRTVLETDPGMDPSPSGAVGGLVLPGPAENWDGAILALLFCGLAAAGAVRRRSP